MFHAKSKSYTVEDRGRFKSLARAGNERKWRGGEILIAEKQIQNSKSLAHARDVAALQYFGWQAAVLAAAPTSMLVLLEPEEEANAPVWLTLLRSRARRSSQVAVLRVAAPRTGRAVNGTDVLYYDMPGRATEVDLAHTLATWVPVFDVVVPTGQVSSAAAQLAARKFPNVKIQTSVAYAYRFIQGGGVPHSTFASSAVNRPESLSSLSSHMSSLSPETRCGSQDMAVKLICDAKSRTADFSANSEPAEPCGFCRQSSSAAYLLGVAEKLRALKETECKDLTVYGVAFGASHFDLMSDRLVGAEQAGILIRQHGRCFFRFVLSDDVEATAGDPNSTHTFSASPTWDILNHSVDMLNLLVPLERDKLPFEGMRRNVKVLKMLGGLLFPWVERLVWVDTKLLVGTISPSTYYDETVEQAGVCAAFIGLPLHVNTFGNMESRSFEKHAETILRVSKTSRAGVTDSRDAVRKQARTYITETNNSIDLSRNLIDSAYIAWNLRSERCSAFNLALGCRWFSEILCFSDRDQLSFPYVLSKLGRHTMSSGPVGDGGVLVDATSAPVVNILPPGSSGQNNRLMHWYYSRGVALMPSAFARKKRVPVKPKTEEQKRQIRKRLGAVEVYNSTHMRRKVWIRRKKKKKTETETEPTRTSTDVAR